MLMTMELNKGNFKSVVKGISGHMQDMEMMRALMNKIGPLDWSLRTDVNTALYVARIYASMRGVNVKLELSDILNRTREFERQSGPVSDWDAHSRIVRVTNQVKRDIVKGLIKNGHCYMLKLVQQFFGDKLIELVVVEILLEFIKPLSPLSEGLVNCIFTLMNLLPTTMLGILRSNFRALVARAPIKLVRKVLDTIDPSKRHEFLVSSEVGEPVAPGGFISAILYGNTGTILYLLAQLREESILRDIADFAARRGQIAIVRFIIDNSDPPIFQTTDEWGIPFVRKLLYTAIDSRKDAIAQLIVEKFPDMSLEGMFRAAMRTEMPKFALYLLENHRGQLLGEAVKELYLARDWKYKGQRQLGVVTRLFNLVFPHVREPGRTLLSLWVVGGAARADYRELVSWALGAYKQNLKGQQDALEVAYNDSISNNSTGVLASLLAIYPKYMTPDRGVRYLGMSNTAEVVQLLREYGARPSYKTFLLWYKKIETDQPMSNVIWNLPMPSASWFRALVVGTQWMRVVPPLTADAKYSIVTTAALRWLPLKLKFYDRKFRDAIFGIHILLDWISEDRNALVRVREILEVRQTRLRQTKYGRRRRVIGGWIGVRKKMPAHISREIADVMSYRMGLDHRGVDELIATVEDKLSQIT
jgi:hypothetical protein